MAAVFTLDSMYEPKFLLPINKNKEMYFKSVGKFLTKIMVVSKDSVTIMQSVEWKVIEKIN